MGKGSKRRPTNEKQFRENWDKIFGNKKKADEYWDSDFEEQCRELYGDNMPDIEDLNYDK